MTPATAPADPGPPALRERKARANGRPTAHARRRIERGRQAIADAVDKRVHEARRTARKARFAAEDIVGIGAIVLRRHPFRAAVAAFGLGAAAGLAVRRLTGFLAGRLARRQGSRED